MTGSDNLALAQSIVAALRTWGVEVFVVCPGARSSPLAAAVGGGPDVVSHFEERGAAFYALGRAKVSGRPAVVVTTSGTAVANLHPAAVEALHAEAPLILLTADRPARLRGTGANQTIDQRGIFGPSVLWWGAIPEQGDRMAGALAALESAWRAALGVPQGPVHLNCPFDEPLLPTDADRPPATVPAAPPIPRDLPTAQALDMPAGGGRGLVVVGRLSEEEQAGAELILELAEALGWPVFADALAGLPSRGPVIPHADFLLSARDWPAPKAVLHLGGAVVSKRVGVFSAKAPAASCLQVSRSPRAWDPLGQNPRKVTADPIAVCRHFLATAAGDAGGGWLPVWREAGRAAEALLEQKLAGTLHEPAVARAVAAALPDGCRLFLGNSLPVRDFDAFAQWPGGRRRVHGNRGASGIDGNLATAAALAEYSPTVALVGDVTALHDLPSLAIAHARNLPLVVVVLNNRGGAIFRFLELAGAPLQPLWETPHAFSLAGVARSMGWTTRKPETAAEFDSALRRALADRRPALLEIDSDPERNHALHLELKLELSRTLAAAPGSLLA